VHASRWFDRSAGSGHRLRHPTVVSRDDPAADRDPRALAAVRTRVRATIAERGAFTIRRVTGVFEAA